MCLIYRNTHRISPIRTNKSQSVLRTDWWRDCGPSKSKPRLSRTYRGRTSHWSSRWTERSYLPLSRLHPLQSVNYCLKSVQVIILACHAASQLSVWRVCVAMSEISCAHNDIIHLVRLCIVIRWGYEYWCMNHNLYEWWWMINNLYKSVGMNDELYEKCHMNYDLYEWWHVNHNLRWQLFAAQWTHARIDNYNHII